MRRPDSTRLASFASSALLLALLAGLLPASLAAHEIPADVTVMTLIKAEGQRLRVLVRVPLEAMRDIDFPLRDSTYLELTAAQRSLRDAAKIWIVDYLSIRENGRALAEPRIANVRAALPSNRSFLSYEAALEHLRGPPLRDIDLPWQQALLDIELEYTITSPASRFSIDPQFARLGVRTQTVLRFFTPEGEERTYHFLGNPGTVPLDPRWHQAALTFVKLGFEHILAGIDHLLFLLCLLIPFRKLKPLIVIVTAFTIAHSITLIAAARGWVPNALWFPPLIEMLIAASIVYMALENIVGAKLQRRWLVAFGFGLVHGFGFSFALRDSLQLAGEHVTTSLLSFNLGVELGQILILLLAVPLVELLFRRVIAERLGTIIISALITHTAWHWMIERGATLREYSFTWGAIRPDGYTLMRTLLVLALLGSSVWLVRELYRRFSRPAQLHAGRKVE